jgi:protein tyrosine phosphatase (PTP) superfamily phosphohydrolase (DUF442 family)
MRHQLIQSIPPLIIAIFLTACASPQVLEYSPNGEIKCMRSAQPSNAQLKALKDQNFSTIVNLREVHTQAEYAASLGLNYYTLPIQNVQPSPDKVELFLEILSDESNYPILIHCGQGIHRTGVMSAIYRIEMQNWSNEQAAEEMVSNLLFHLTYRNVSHCKDFILNYEKHSDADNRAVRTKHPHTI